MGPLLTLEVCEQLATAIRAGAAAVRCSLDLGLNAADVALNEGGFIWRGRHFRLPHPVRERTVYYWDGAGFAAVARYTSALVKLVPTEWGPPTFEIDGIKMLPSARLSPLVDAARKVDLVVPRGKRILDTCAGLGYFAACALKGGAREVVSYEKNADVLWLRN